MFIEVSECCGTVHAEPCVTDSDFHSDTGTCSLSVRPPEATVSHRPSNDLFEPTFEEEEVSVTNSECAANEGCCDNPYTTNNGVE